MRDHYGPWALIIGASDGIGAAFAETLAARGLDVVLVARRRPLLDELAARLSAQHGVRANVIIADVSTVDGLAEVLGVVADLEPGMLVANAAHPGVGEFLDRSPADLDAALDLNCRAAVQLAHAVASRLVARRRGGGIILVSSLAGLQGCALIAHYAATKAYLRVLAEGLWVELRPRGVDVLACCPGPVRTPTYSRGNPRPGGWFVPAPMPPDRVVRDSLAALGRRPVVIAGWANRLAAAATQRLLPRRMTLALTSARVRAMYPTE
jgi:short-subunit dehydrogenase